MSMVFTALLFSLALQTPQPPAQTPSRGAGQAAPVVVIGCLQSSNVNGHDVFTLTSRDTNRPAADIKTRTYQLNPTAGVDLKAKVGQRVEVTGVEAAVGNEATNTVDSRTTEKPSGTSGKTPTVETKERTDIVVRQMNVTSVKTLANNCRVP